MRLLINKSSALLTRIFQIYLDLKIYSDYFKRAFTVILHKLNKADYFDLLIYHFIILLNILEKILEIIIITHIRDLIKTHVFLLDI